jgi:hypothetical protein
VITRASVSHRTGGRPLDIDVGRRIHPTITPDDPEAVERILNQQATP